MERRGVGEASLAHKQRRQAAALHMRGGIRRARAMDLITPRICAGHDISCPYEETAMARRMCGMGKGTLFFNGASRSGRGKPRPQTAAASRRTPHARRHPASEGDGLDHAKDLCRVRYIVPLRNRRRRASESDGFDHAEDLRRASAAADRALTKPAVAGEGGRWI